MLAGRGYGSDSFRPHLGRQGVAQGILEADVA